MTAELDITIEGVNDLQTIVAIERAVRCAFDRVGITERCTVAVSPADTKPGWSVGIFCRSAAEALTVVVGIEGAAPSHDRFADALEAALRGRVPECMRTRSTPGLEPDGGSALRT
jgi:hypothetical protein